MGSGMWACNAGKGPGFSMKGVAGVHVLHGCEYTRVQPSHAIAGSVVCTHAQARLDV